MRIDNLRNLASRFGACVAQLFGKRMNGAVFESLYKYRKFDTNALRILESKELYFATPETLNDPLDCQLPVLTLLNQVIASEPAGRPRDLLLKLRDMNVTNRETGEVEFAHRTFETLPLTTGVLSLSRNPTDALLWSHYADGHRGFCIGFDVSYFADLITEWQRHGLLGADDVRYVEVPPFRDLWLQKARDIEAINSVSREDKDAAKAEFWESYVRDIIVTVLTTKSKDWAYEREYRAVKKQPGAVAFPPSALKEIIFGLRSSEADQGMIRTLLNGPEWKHVRFRRPVCTVGTFAINLVDC